MPLPPLLLFNCVLDVLATAIMPGKERKGTLIGKKDTKPSLFAGVLTIYVENLEETAKLKLLELISNYRNVSGYKANLQKSITFLYTSNKKWNLKFKRCRCH